MLAACSDPATSVSEAGSETGTLSSTETAGQDDGGSELGSAETSTTNAPGDETASDTGSSGGSTQDSTSAGDSDSTSESDDTDDTDDTDGSSTGEQAEPFACAWQPPVGFEGSMVTSNAIDLGVDDTGRVTLLTSDPSNGGQSATAYRYEMGVWSAATELTAGSAGGEFPRLHIGSGSEGIVAWANDDGVFARTFTPPNWGSQSTILSPINTYAAGSSLDIVVDSQGNAVAAWRDGAPQTQSAVNVARLEAGAAQWSEPVQLNEDYILAQGPKLVLAGDDTVLVGWVESAEIMVMPYDTSSGQVGDIVSVGPGAAFEIAADPMGNAWVSVGSAGDIWLARRDGATGSWGALAPLVEDLTSIFGQTRLIVAPNGDSYLIYSRSAVPGETYATVVRYDALTAAWEEPVIIDDEPESGPINLAVNAAGNAVLIWRQGEQLRSACRDAGLGQWGPIVDVDTGELFPSSAAVVLSDDNEATLAFTNFGQVRTPFIEPWVIQSQ